jgi:hypothetical protein
MKKAVIVALLAAMCSLCLLFSIGLVIAAMPGYTHLVYSAQNPVTIDGKWTSEAEWSDCGPQTNIFENAVFRSKWSLVFSDTEFYVYQWFLVEVLNDNTNDTGDYLRICFDGGEEGPTGGVAPQSNDLRIDIIGHTDAIVYRGTGTGWAQIDTPPTSQLQWNNSISTSPISNTEHWVYEIMIEKTALGIGPVFWARIALYDASNSEAGEQAWPPGSSLNVPNDWGDFPYSQDPIPEGLSFVAMVLLSSVAVLVRSYYLHKRPKRQN